MSFIDYLKTGKIIKESKESKEAVYAVDLGTGKKFRIYDMGVSWATLIPEDGDVEDKIKMPIGDLHEEYDLYDIDDNLVRAHEEDVDECVKEATETVTYTANKRKFFPHGDTKGVDVIEYAVGGDDPKVVGEDGLHHKFFTVNGKVIKHMTSKGSPLHTVVAKSEYVGKDISDVLKNFGIEKLDESVIKEGKEFEAWYKENEADIEDEYQAYVKQSEESGEKPLSKKAWAEDIHSGQISDEDLMSVLSGGQDEYDEAKKENRSMIKEIKEATETYFLVTYKDAHGKEQTTTVAAANEAEAKEKIELRISGDIGGHVTKVAKTTKPITEDNMNEARKDFTHKIDDETSVRVYDNGGETLDRYSIVLIGKDWLPDAKGFVPMLGLDGSAGRSFSQFTSGQEGKHLGKPVKFSDLSDETQKHIISRVKADEEEIKKECAMKSVNESVQNVASSFIDKMF